MLREVEERADNAFAARCGLEIGTTGTIHSVLQLTASDNKKVKKQYGMPGMTIDPENCRETQTDPIPELRSADCNLQTQMKVMPGSASLPAASSNVGEILLDSTYIVCPAGLPEPGKVLGRSISKLCRRVITDTGTGRIVSDEYMVNRLLFIFDGIFR